MALVNAMNGTVAGQYEYGPFGELLRATGPMAFTNPFRFSTKYQDDETGLLMYPARPYNPSTGRWLARDPLEEPGAICLAGLKKQNGDIDASNFVLAKRQPGRTKKTKAGNLVQFLANDPLNKVDPLGKDAAVINEGGYRGHTCFAICDSDGGNVTVFHFYAKHWGNANNSSSGGALAICCDGIHIWSETWGSLAAFLQSEETIGGTTVYAYALGTAQDDANMISSIQIDMQAQSGIYSILLGKECHAKSWDWFNKIRVGGKQIYPTLSPGEDFPLFYPQQWWETRLYLQGQSVINVP